MKKILIILLSLNMIFGISEKWNLATNTNAYPLVKFKFAKSFIEEKILPFNHSRGFMAGKSNRQKFLDSDGYYRFSMRGIAFTNQEGVLPQNMTRSQVNQLTNPLYKRMNSMNVSYREAKTLNDFLIDKTEYEKPRFLTNRWIIRHGVDKYIKYSNNIQFVKICFITPYQKELLLLGLTQGAYRPDKNKKTGIGTLLLKENDRYLQQLVHMGRYDMQMNMVSFIEMVDGNIEQIITDGSDGKDYPEAK